MFSRLLMKGLYRSCEAGTLAGGDRTHSDGAHSALDSLARALSALLRPSRAATRPAVHGVFSDSDRKSMQAMLARVTQPVTYQAFQHFIASSPTAIIQCRIISSCVFGCRRAAAACGT
jgi:hypothetical protein